MFISYWSPYFVCFFFGCINALFNSTGVVLLNMLPLTLVMLCIYFLTSRIWISYIVTGSFYFVVQVVNYFKISLRQEPFVPADILLGNESTNVVKINELPINGGLIFLLVLFLIVGLGLFYS